MRIRVNRVYRRQWVVSVKRYANSQWRPVWHMTVFESAAKAKRAVAERGRGIFEVMPRSTAK